MNYIDRALLIPAVSIIIVLIGVVKIIMDTWIWRFIVRNFDVLVLLLMIEPFLLLMIVFLSMDHDKDPITSLRYGMALGFFVLVPLHAFLMVLDRRAKGDEEQKEKN